MPALYSLTGLTGKAAKNARVATFQGFEARRTTWVAIGVGVGVGLASLGLGYPFLGARAVLVAAAVGMLAGAATVARSKDGMRRLWVRTQVDKRRIRLGTFYIYGRPIDPLKYNPGVLSASAVPADGKDTW